MGKAADRLKATMGITVESKTPADQLYSNSPKTAPGKLVLAHQEARAYKQEAEALRKRVVKISELHEIAGRKRSLAKEEFEILKSNLEHNPLGQPIVIKARQQGGYEIIAGHNRVQAYKELGRQEIEAHISEIDDDQIFKVGFYTNLITSNLTDFEKYLGFKEVMKEAGMTQERAAKEAGGIDQSLVSKLLSTFDGFSENAKKLLQVNPRAFGLSAAQEIVKAEEGGILKAIQARTTDPKLAEKAAVQIALNVVKSTKISNEVKVIKSGKKNFAKITNRPGLISVKLEDEALTAELEGKIFQLISDFIANMKVS